MTVYNVTDTITASYLAELQIVELSGTVTKSTNPVQRTVVAYKHPNYTLPYIALSDPIDGVFTLEIAATPLDRLIVIILGENSGEFTQVFDWILI